MAQNSSFDPKGHRMHQEIFFSDFVVFRNPHILEAVIVQILMIICAFLIFLGIIYAIILLIVMAIHHYIFDRDPHHVPDYVKGSVEFSSDEESEMTGLEYWDWEKHAEALNLRKGSFLSGHRRESGDKREGETYSSTSSEEEQPGPSTSTKIDQLDKFMTGNL